MWLWVFEYLISIRNARKSRMNSALHDLHLSEHRKKEAIKSNIYYLLSTITLHIEQKYRENRVY